MANHAEPTLAHAAYGRFSRRLRAFLIDWIIIVLLLTAALFLAISANSEPNRSRYRADVRRRLVPLRTPPRFTHWKHSWSLPYQFACC